MLHVTNEHDVEYLSQLPHGSVNGRACDLAELGSEDPDTGIDTSTHTDHLHANVLPLAVAICPDDQEPHAPGLPLQRPLDLDHVVLPAILLHWKIKQLDGMAGIPLSVLLAEVHAQEVAGHTGHDHVGHDALHLVLELVYLVVDAEPVPPVAPAPGHDLRDVLGGIVLLRHIEHLVIYHVSGDPSSIWHLEKGVLTKHRSLLKQSLEFLIIYIVQTLAERLCRTQNSRQKVILLLYLYC